MKGDVSTAFLQGVSQEGKRGIFGDPPPVAREILGLRKDQVMRFLKAVYGFLHAPAMWQKKFDEVMKAQGWILSKKPSPNHW